MTSDSSKKGKYFWMIFLGSIILIVLAFISLRFAYAEEDVSNRSVDVYELNDSHLHLTNYIQEGTDIHKMLQIMDDKVGRAAIFGIPLQQQWDYHISGDHAPQYYLESDASLYYYSFTDAQIAMAYNSLTKEQKSRFDPMITGFNPSDMYAVDHIKRVLLTFPGVFSGIGEFTIHKEFVSSKVAGGAASITDPALDSILDFAGESGLAVILHNDIDIPFAKAGEAPAYLSQMKDLLRRHKRTTIIWAHIGLGRVIHPVQSGTTPGPDKRTSKQIEIVSAILKDPSLKHVHFDISWEEVAKYILRNDSTVTATAELINQFPDRFIFGTDVVAPSDQETYLKLYYRYDPLFKKLKPETRAKVVKLNYERIFDNARRKVRAWEKNNGAIANLNPK